MIAAMEYCQKMVKFMPSNGVRWDDACNSRALIPAKPAPIWNPPSAWAMAKRDALQLSADCWTFPNPPGPKGRLVPHMERRRAAERHQPSAPPEIAVQIWNRYLVPGMVGSC